MHGPYKEILKYRMTLLVLNLRRLKWVKMVHISFNLMSFGLRRRAYPRARVRGKGGYDIPLDAILLVNAWTIQIDSKIWDDITSFKPETFEMGEDGPHKFLMSFGLRRRAYPRARVRGKGCERRQVPPLTS
ncbi:cytochrome p450 81e8 [Quercus suber]|uniref:Cytochrome p450 81e8 n=1 Tax=Quercus suber TaxID=58331 RepID=A0AAW0L384_QUESU